MFTVHLFGIRDGDDGRFSGGGRGVDGFRNSAISLNICG